MSGVVSSGVVLSVVVIAGVVSPKVVSAVVTATFGDTLQEANSVHSTNKSAINEKRAWREIFIFSKSPL
jgi:hypothetical protein